VGPFGLEQISDVQIGFLLKIKNHQYKLYFKYRMGRKLQHKIIKEACSNQLFFTPLEKFKVAMIVSQKIKTGLSHNFLTSTEELI